MLFAWRTPTKLHIYVVKSEEKYTILKLGKLEFVFYSPQIIEATLYKVTTNKNTPNSKKWIAEFFCCLSLYSLDVINIVVAKQTNVVGIEISVERAFVKLKIANATVSAEKNSFRFFIQSLLLPDYNIKIYIFQWCIAPHNDVARFTRNDAMFAKCAVRHTSLAVASSLVKRHHLPKGKHHSKKIKKEKSF